MPYPCRPCVEGKYQCNACQVWKGPSEFGSSGVTKNGLLSQCKICTQKRRAKRIQPTYQERMARHPEHWLRDALRSRFRAAYKRALKAGLQFDIDRERLESRFISQEGLCHYTGLPMTYAPGQGHTWAAVSLDRVDNSKGYTKDNTVLCCYWANTAKNNHDLTWVEMICRAFLSHFPDKENP